jgi:chorismate mutase
MKVALKIEKEKRKTNLPISFPEVEKKRIKAIKEIAKNKKLNLEFVEIIFKKIIAESVRVQEEQRDECSNCSKCSKC